MFRRYSFWHQLFDFVMIILTGGLWMIWIYLRYLRTNTRHSR